MMDCFFGGGKGKGKFGADLERSYLAMGTVCRCLYLKPGVLVQENVEDSIHTGIVRKVDGQYYLVGYWYRYVCIL